jgi:hypothetical protein
MTSAKSSWQPLKPLLQAELLIHVARAKALPNSTQFDRKLALR